MEREIQSEKADIETSSEDYTSRFTGEIGKYFLDTQSGITLKLLTSENVKTILDVGGGHAQLAVPLVKNGYSVTVTGSDTSCRNRLNKFLIKDEFTFIECNLLNLPFENNSFDAVIAFRLLTHEKNWKILVREMCRVSKNVIIIDYPDKRSFNILYEIMFKLKRKYEKNTRTYYSFTRNEIKNEFIKNGYNLFKFVPQFFFPMVLHRAIKVVAVSKTLETIAGLIGLKHLFGSPIILKIKK